MYNVFIQDQYNYSISEDENDSLDNFTLSQLLRSLDWLSLIKHIPEVYSTLCKTTITMWENELIQIHFKQYLDLWEGLKGAHKKSVMYLMNRVHLDVYTNCHSDFIQLLSNIKEKYLRSEWQDIMPVVMICTTGRTSSQVVRDL